MATTENNEIKPWGLSSTPLLVAGWEVIPLPRGEKGPPARGLTGAGGVALEEDSLLEFPEAGNIGVRMPVGVVGLDFDLYRERATLRLLEKRLGELPKTFATTSHNSPMEQGFTAFFKVPEGTNFKSGWRGMDIIQRSHRYSVVAPSLHPSGRTYRWVHTSNPNISMGRIPEAEELPELPDKWLNFLREKETATFGGDADFVLSEMDGLQMCGAMRKGLQISLNKLRSVPAGSSRHNAGVKAAWHLASLRASGHEGYAAAREVYSRSFLKALAGSEGRIAGKEAGNLFQSAERKLPLRRGASCGCGKGRGGAGLRRGGVSGALFRAF